MKFIFLVVCICLFGPFSSVAYADLNSDISAACASGGAVVVPATITVTTSINLRCPGVDVQ